MAARQLTYFLLVATCFLIAACRKTSPESTLLHLREELRLGQLDAALRDADHALELYKKDPAWAARFRVFKSRVLMTRGAYSESLRLSDEPLPTTLGATDTEVERKMVQGLDFAYLQQFDPADQAISEAESLASQINSALSGAVAQTRGMLEVDRKDYARATVAFRSAAAFGREHGLPRAELDAFGNLGNVAMWQEHYDEAADRFRVALDKARTIRATDAESRALGNLGWSYSSVGDFDNAEISFRDAAEKAAKAGLPEDETYWRIALAEVYFQQRRYPEADSLARSSLALAESHDDKNTLTTCLNTLSQIALLTGRIADAERFNLRATEIENSGLDQFGINYSQLLAGRISFGKREYRAAEAAFRKVLADPKVETPLKWEAHARLAQVFAADQQLQKAEREFDIAINTVESARAAIESNDFQVSFLSSAIEFYDSYVNFLIGRSRPVDALKIADLSRSQSLEPSSPPSSRPGSKAPGFDPQSVARRTRSTMLYYWLGSQKSWLWVITPSRISLLPLPPGPQIEALVRSYRESFILPADPVEADDSDGKQLYAILIQPAAKLLPADPRVVILPDGALNTLNFESLIVTDPKPHYWIEDSTVVTASSISLLSRAFFEQRPTSNTMLLIGDPLFASPDFPPLPQAAKELGLLERYFPAERRLELTKERAVPAAYFSSAPEKFAYLHFTTHGTASRQRPLESAVILSPEGDSFKLYARDIVRRPISAYLVTISACNGAGIKTYAGAGLIGLAWAFLRAGAHNVIAGLWEVSAASTPQLMDELYKNLHAGQDPATALRNAKLTLLHSAGNYRRPFYWAPFLLYSGS